MLPQSKCCSPSLTQNISLTAALDVITHEVSLVSPRLPVLVPCPSLVQQSPGGSGESGLALPRLRGRYRGNIRALASLSLHQQVARAPLPTLSLAPAPRYHCSDCQGPHRDVIPSRLLYNWDAAPRPVSRAAHTFLAHIAAKPLVNISTFNPSLAKIAPGLEEAARLRKQLTYLVAYLAACTRAQVRQEGRVDQAVEVCA